MARLRLGVRRG